MDETIIVEDSGPLLSGQGRKAPAGSTFEALIISGPDAELSVPAAAPLIIPGVRHGGPAATAKRIESALYSLFKQGGGVVAIGYALTHHTGLVEWSGFALFYVLGILSITLCYHRHFCHKSFDAPTPMRYVLGIWGQLGAYGSLRNWCIDHRRHHARSDKIGDVHSPLFDCYGQPLTGWRGFSNSHMGWLFDDATTDHDIYGRGLVGDPVVEFCHRTRVLWFVVSILAIPAAWGWAWGGPQAILGTVLIAGCLRMALSLQFIAMVNSVCHRWGSARFPGQGLARNNAIVAILTCGEGWHNNHHAHPRSANFGMVWWEVDVCSWFIWTFEKLGWITNVNRVRIGDFRARGAVAKLPGRTAMPAIQEPIASTVPASEEARSPQAAIAVA